jgi:hypothetical protein
MTRYREKWKYYSGRYGALHAFCAFVGRKTPRFWNFVGPAVTGPYGRKWLAGPHDHIVNLGGGGNIGQDWLTADIDPRSDVFVDLTRPLPWPDGALDGFFLEEVVEHIQASSTERLFHECHRCLATDKPIRMATPDMRWIPVLLDSSTVPAGLLNENALKQLGFQDCTMAEMKVAAANSIFRCHGHLFIWDFASLSAALARAGFRSIQQSSYRDAHSLLGKYDSHAHRFAHPSEMSVYIEAIK